MIGRKENLRGPRLMNSLARKPSICHSPTPGLMNRSSARKPSLVMSQAFLSALISSGFLIWRISAMIS